MNGANGETFFSIFLPLYFCHLPLHLIFKLIHFCIGIMKKLMKSAKMTKIIQN